MAFDDDFFDDPFEDIVKEFFGNNLGAKRRRKEQFIRGESEDRSIDFVEDENHVYIVFELQGYSERDVAVSINGRELEIKAKKSNVENLPDYLRQKLKQGIIIQKKLPNFISLKKFAHTMRNGVLEIAFEKSKGK